MNFLRNLKNLDYNAGKMTVLSSFAVALVLTLILVGVSQKGVEAQDTAETFVRVLNTAPVWSVDAQESPESSLTNPTNSGSGVSWTATATDANNDNFYLLICKTGDAPTPGAGGAAPSCNGGASNQWAVSAATPSGSQATATYTTSESDANQSNAWFAFICDNHSESPRCNAQAKQGSGSTASPFVINFRPTFTVFADDSPRDPGQTVTWTSTAADSVKNTDASFEVRLFVCRANDFTGTACGAGGTWCSSNFAASNPTCQHTLANIKQDKDYEAFGFVIDERNHAAQGGAHGTDSVLTVNNVAPSISSAVISLLNWDDDPDELVLTEAEGLTQGFKVTFTVTDNNSCQNASGGNEIASAEINVYRSGVGAGSCNLDSHFNANSCYPAAATDWWTFTCNQNAGASGCSGPSSAEANWTCTFPLWYVADPTTGADNTVTQFFDQDWRVSVRAMDDNDLNTGFVQGDTGIELAPFVAFRLDPTSINYGDLETGQDTGTLSEDTALYATGNTGLNESLAGTDMCTTFDTGEPNNGCTGDPSNTIPVTEQQYAASGVAYGSGTALTSSLTTFVLNIQKTTATSTPQSKDTFWGIRIPLALTLSGDYRGENTVLGVKSNAQNW